MFTQNYINWQKAAFTGGGYSFVDNTGSTYTNGNISNANAVMYTALAYLMGVPTRFTDDSGMVFGTDSTPATKADYKLGSQITENLAFTKGTVSVVPEVEGRYMALVTHTLTNNSDSDMNIYEIGLMGRCYAASSQRYTLLERTVLSEPITIPPGGSKFVTYKITFNQTLNVD